DIPQLDLSYQGGLFQAAGRAMQSGTTTQLASFALVGQRFFRGEFTGQLYLDVDSGRLFDGLIDDLNWRGIRVEGFDLGGSAWLSFEDGELQQVQGQVRTPYLQLGVNRESLAPLEDIQAHFGWRRGEALRLQKLRWDWIGDQVLPFSVRIEDGQDELKLVADSLPLKPLRRLVQALELLPDAASEALEHYQPAGFLDDMLFTLPEQGSRFSLSARLREFGVRAWSGAPRAEGLYGFIQMNPDSGRVTLDTPEPAMLGFPQLFNTDWMLDSLSGTVAWTLEGGITRVFSDDLEFIYRSDTRLSGAFDLRLDRYGEDNLGLSVGVEGGNADMLADFVPANAVGEGLYEWLTNSIPEAGIRGQYYGHGRIDSSAPAGSFVSSMWYEFDNATIRYDQRWPAVEQASGRVEIQNADTRVMLARGEIGGLELENASVHVLPGDGEAGTLVRVDAVSTVPAERIPWWLAHPPLGDLLGYGTTRARYDGKFELSLGLELPLSQGKDTRVTAQVKTDNAGFQLPDAGLRWQNIRA
ncbi:MAG: DUF3971 domain-containing protein, partial [Pseudomonadota bacterium]|nr:DUF3971 domain-containing protein [Pseudomonadota bacterium]